MATLSAMLDSYRIPISPLAARLELARLVSVEGLGWHGLYQQLFPNEWSRSRRSVTRQHDAAFSEREVEFFELVVNQMFPLWPGWDTDYSGMYWEEFENEEDAARFVRGSLMATMRVEPAWPGVWSVWSQWHDSANPKWWPLIALASPYYRERANEHKLEWRVQGAAPEVSLDILHTLCGRINRGPLQHLALAVEVIKEQSSCLFWQMIGEGEDFGEDPWEVEVMRLWAADYARFEDEMGLIEDLLHWIAEDEEPFDRWEGVLRLWNRSRLNN